MRERGNPALARQVVADEGDLPNFSSPSHGCHRTLILTTGRFTSGSDFSQKSSPSCPHPGSSCLEPGRRRDCGCTAARHYGSAPVRRACRDKTRAVSSASGRTSAGTCDGSASLSSSCRPRPWFPRCKDEVGSRPIPRASMFRSGRRPRRPGPARAGSPSLPAAPCSID